MSILHRDYQEAAGVDAMAFAPDAPGLFSLPQNPFALVVVVVKDLVVGCNHNVVVVALVVLKQMRCLSKSFGACCTRLSECL